MYLKASQIVPDFVQKILRLGPVPSSVKQLTEIGRRKLWFGGGDLPQLNHDIVSEGVDCIVLVQTAWDPARLQKSLDRLHGILNPEGRLSILIGGLDSSPVDKNEWKRIISAFHLVQYHFGRFVESPTMLWGVTAVRRMYDPLRHAYRLATQDRVSWAKSILKDIPEAWPIDAQKYEQMSRFILDDNESIRKENFMQSHAINTNLAHSAWYRSRNNEVNLSAGAKIQSEISDKLPSKPIYLGLVKGENYGWGVCSRYFIDELSKIRSVNVINGENGSDKNSNLPGVLFQAIINVDFDCMFSEARAGVNIGYTFFENELTEKSLNNARNFDLVLGGSSWCHDRMVEKGILNCDVLIQGIDPKIFYPINRSPRNDRFMIFSGGKFELRKGQDLVLRAVKIMQEKYPDVWLVNCWYNLWPSSTQLMRYSPHIKFEHHNNESWLDTMHRTYMDNGLDASRIITHELVPQDQQRELFAYTDIGLFPNRCEGGTNLVLMEYMACGKPVIAASNTGHKDIVNDRNALMLNHQSPFNIVGPKGELIGRWSESSLDEIVARLEYAYHNRDALKPMARQAGEDLKQFTWANSTKQLLSYLERY